MRFGTFCSGIAAPEVAWAGLGWSSRWFSEIDPFACAVLADRFPNTPNLGDMTKLHGGDLEPVGLVCAGTPCQSFSVAGLRAGMDDPRGNLALVLLGLVDKIRPLWLVWENVPGVLSSTSGEPASAPPNRLGVGHGEQVVDECEYDETDDFRCFTSALTELGYGWAFRVLDAQYTGVPQRRRRVFVVGYLGDWRCAAAVLFERHSLSRDSAPRREEGARIAGSITNRVDRGGVNSEGHDGHLVPQVVGCLSHGAHMRGGLTDKTHIAGELSRCLNAGGMGRQDFETETLIPVIGGFFDDVARPFLGKSNCSHDESKDSLIVTHSLRADGFDASEDGTGRGTPIIPILEAGKRCGTRNSARDGIGVGADGDPMFAFQSGAQHAIAFAQNQRGEVRTMSVAGALAGEPGMKQQTYVYIPLGVRRLTPLECERLQGLPDNWTLVPYRGKSASDGPRYRAIGNSMAIPVLRWIGERIQAVDSISPAPISPSDAGRGGK